MTGYLFHQVYAAGTIAEGRKECSINGLSKTLPIHLGMGLKQLGTPRHKFYALWEFGNGAIAKRDFHALPLDVVADEH